MSDNVLPHLLNDSVSLLESCMRFVANQSQIKLTSNIHTTLEYCMNMTDDISQTFLVRQSKILTAISEKVDRASFFDSVSTSFPKETTPVKPQGIAAPMTSGKAQKCGYTSQ